MPDEISAPTYSLAELCDLADVTPRTVRYYVQQGLLRSPDVAGPQTRYEEGHLWRLRSIRQLQREHLPLGRDPQATRGALRRGSPGPGRGPAGRRP